MQGGFNQNQDCLIKDSNYLKNKLVSGEE